MLRIYIAVLILAIALASTFASARDCSDLSGHYRFFGIWEHRSFEGGNPESIAAYIAANPEPRLDRFALGIYTREVRNPRVAVLRQDLVTGIVEVDITGDLKQPKVEDSAPKLPASIPLVCNGSEWRLERVATGGGENTPSKEREQIVLRVEPNGDLLVKGHTDMTSGWIFKTKISSDWLARFQRIDEHLAN